MKQARPTNKRVSPEVKREVLATYRRTLNLDATSKLTGLHPGIVTEVVEAEWGGKDERWRAGTELARLRQARKRIRPAPPEVDMGPRVDPRTINRRSPDDLCRALLGGRFEERHGSYWLDGRHCPDINVRMRAVNRVLVAEGRPQLPVPEWRV